MMTPSTVGESQTFQGSRKHSRNAPNFIGSIIPSLRFFGSRIYDKLKVALYEKTNPFEFKKWQRAVKYKYAIAPLSAKGSLSDPGGRFNIGAIDTARFPTFAALYLAHQKRTALAELLGRDGPIGSFAAEELALTKSASITIVSLAGKLDSVLDVRDAKNLEPFVGLIKNFNVSDKLRAKARKVAFPVNLVRRAADLVVALAGDRWREWPMGFDVPAVTQVFGRIAFDAGIEGVLYDSALTDDPCLAIYLQNFQNSPSFVEIDDDCPAEVVHRRIDRETFKNCI
jgi:hypothetical protein